jgi:predicted lipoprotein with Yx(FWY)xxD motif
MKHMLHIAGLALALTLAAGGSAMAACTVEYKAKQDNPLRLDHGTITLPECGSRKEVEKAVSDDLAARGWILLKIVGTTKG